MILYHGSTIVVDTPQILASNLDFGEGFYTTSNPVQAERWANKVADRKNSNTTIINRYEFDIEKAKQNLQIVEFLNPNTSWLHFVTICRSGKWPDIEYAIAIGPVANDSVYTTIQLFETGILDEEETIRRLKVAELFDQYLFHTAEFLRYLKYIGCIQKEAAHAN